MLLATFEQPTKKVSKSSVIKLQEFKYKPLLISLSAVYQQKYNGFIQTGKFSINIITQHNHKSRPHFSEKYLKDKELLLAPLHPG
jgi:hypothetical protein